MRVAHAEAYGGPEVISIIERPIPVPKDDELLIKVRVSSVSTGDARMRRADPSIVRLFNGFTKPRNAVFGSEFSGEVVGIGNGVKGFSLGDLVCGGKGFDMGSNAEYITIKASEAVAKLPESMTHREGACITFGAGTSLYFLRDKAKIKKGEKILIMGASGALGVYAVQLASYYGAEVWALASKKNHDMLRRLGAKHCIDYHSENLEDYKGQFDIVYETVGRYKPTEYSYLAKPGGRFVGASVMPSAYPAVMLHNLLGRPKILTGVVKETKEDVEFLLKLFQEKRLEAVIDSVYPLEEISKAHARVDSGRKRGNVLIEMS